MAKNLPKPKNRSANPRRKAKTRGPKSHIWDRPPFPTRGDRSDRTVMAAVGEALTAWEGLEMEYAGLFEVMMGADIATHAAHRAYGAVLVSSTRRDMLGWAKEAFFATFPGPELEKEVDGVIKLHEKLSARRNDIAHGIVQDFGYRMVGRETPSKTYCLFPSYTATKSVRLTRDDIVFRLEPKYAYTAKHMRSFASKFRAVRPPVAALIEKLRKHQRPQTTPISTVL